MYTRGVAPSPQLVRVCEEIPEMRLAYAWSDAFFLLVPVTYIEGEMAGEGLKQRKGSKAGIDAVQVRHGFDPDALMLGHPFPPISFPLIQFIHTSPPPLALQDKEDKAKPVAAPPKKASGLLDENSWKNLQTLVNFFLPALFFIYVGLTAQKWDVSPYASYFPNKYALLGKSNTPHYHDTHI